VLYALGHRRLVVTGALREGRPLPAWTWLLPVVFVTVPVLTGRFVGTATYGRRRWVKALTGPSPAPRAWDDLFATANLTGWIRLHLVDGSWIAGLWGYSTSTGLQSYAAGYPEDQDLLLADLAETDEDGDLLLDAEGNVLLTGRGLLIRWDQIAYAEFIPA
jgi:hypothetical protein